MTHIHEQTGKEYEVGRLIDGEGKTYDINVIMKWDTEHDFDQSPVLIDYYFGDYEKKDTDNYIDLFIRQQSSLKKVVQFLESKRMIDNDFMSNSDRAELDVMIETVKSLITDLV